MSELIVKVIDDLHAGRTTWRVRLLLGLPALIAGITVALVPLW